jgi:Fe-S cluster assembly ATP-binding protein
MLGIGCDYERPAMNGRAGRCESEGFTPRIWLHKNISREHMLKIDNLHVRVGDREILKGLSLDVQPGQVHAIMGPNGAGKSTLGNVLAGREGYEITAGSVTFDGRDLLVQDPEQRAAEGVFLAFQYPVEIPGVNNTYFLRSALNAQRRARGEPELDSMQFLKLVREKLAVLHLKDELMHRGVNEGFSGGEKKRNEIFQMAVLEPRLAILDETDSGLDIDALKNVAEGVNTLRSPDRAFLVITHYQRLLDYIRPDVVHVLADGRIVETGGPELALQLEEHGYAWVRDRVAPDEASA